jgi:hypothetical protein
LTLQELERHRCAGAAGRDQEAARARANEDRLFELASKHRELELRLKQQREESDSVERMLRQIEDSQTELSRGPDGGDSGRAIARAIERVAAEMQRENPELDRMLADCTDQIAQLKDGIAGEIAEMDMAERWAASRLRRAAVRETARRTRPGRRVLEGDD